MNEYQLEYYQNESGNVPYQDWFVSLDDLKARAIVRTRLNRVRLGNFGDCKSVGEGVHELKIDFGPGYRVYFAKVGLTIVLLLCGGSKKSQRKDISSAIDYLEDYKRRKKEVTNAVKKT